MNTKNKTTLPVFMTQEDYTKLSTEKVKAIQKMLHGFTSAQAISVLDTVKDELPYMSIISTT